MDPKRLRAAYPQIFPMERLSYEEYIKYSGLFEKGKIYDTAVMLGSAKVKSVVFSALTLYKRVSSFEFMMAYRLVDIFLGNDESYNSLLQVTPKLLVLVLGYAGMENRRQEDFIVQVWENQRMQGNNVWLLCRGSDGKFSKEYPQVNRMLQENGVVRKSLVAETVKVGEI